MVSEVIGIICNVCSTCDLHLSPVHLDPDHSYCILTIIPLTIFFQGNYLYADSFDAKGPGTALIYHTRHFPPSKKCLQFWYHMQNVGDSMLNVNIYQKRQIAKEILKIVGHQGNNWKKASVPINAHLNASSYLFKV